MEVLKENHLHGPKEHRDDSQSTNFKDADSDSEATLDDQRKPSPNGRVQPERLGLDLAKPGGSAHDCVCPSHSVRVEHFDMITSARNTYHGGKQSVGEAMFQPYSITRASHTIGAQSYPQNTCTRSSVSQNPFRASSTQQGILLSGRTCVWFRCWLWLEDK